MKKSRPLTFVDLFAGCGGLSLGLEMAGFKPLFVNELNPDALETYLRNRDRKFPLLRTKYRVADVKEMVDKKGKFLNDLASGFKLDYGINTAAGDLDLVVGGPPCQGFSRIGHRRSYSVDKEQVPSNYLYEDMARVIERLRPKLFLFENVGGLQSAKWSRDGTKGEIWSDVQKKLSSIGNYTVRPRLVYSKHYGVPQNRPRVLLVGVRDDLGIRPISGRVADGFLPEPTNGFPDIRDLLSDLIDPNFHNGGSTITYPKAAEGATQQFLRADPETGKVRPKGSPVTEHDYSKHRPEVIKKFRHMIDHHGEIPLSMRTKKFAQRLLPERWGPDGPTITATSLPDDYVHYEQPRTLTVREWARLQMFPDWYQFAGKRTTGGLRRAGNPRAGVFERELPKYTQIGNAVPVALAKAIGEHFARLLRQRA